MNTSLVSLRADLTIADSLNASMAVFLKGLEIAVLALNDPSAPRIVRRLNPHDVPNSAIAVARNLKAAIFADGDDLIVADVNGKCRSLAKASTFLGGNDEINWELAVNDALTTVYLTVISADLSQAFRIVRLDIGTGAFSNVYIERPDSGAYQIDPESGNVSWLVSKDNGMQDLVIDTPSGRSRAHLTHRYDWMRVAPDSDRLLLSPGADTGPISVVSLDGVFPEWTLPVQGHTANWVGHDKVLYHSDGGHLSLYTIGSAKSEPLFELAPPFSFAPGAVAPATVSDDGRVVVWSWVASEASGRQSKGTALVDLVDSKYRVLTTPWRRMALLAL